MTKPSALVVHTRMPAYDRDTGSKAIDDAIGFLLDAGWRVTFLCKEEEGVAEARHAERLRQAGVATFAGLGWIDRILRSNDIGLVIVPFWELAAKLIPTIRELSPDARIVINSIDLHFLRHARRCFGQDKALDTSFGGETASELNAYNSADAVIAVSEKERAILADFLGDDRAFTLPLAESVTRSSVPLPERRGMYFVGNFRHVPNREAAEYLCGEVLPLLDRDLLERHPLSIVGNWLHEAKVDVDPAAPGLQMVGWVPSMEPYIERCRLTVVPLLHGAGVKGKVIQSMMAYTPVVMTPVGAEGLDVVHGEHALVADDAVDLAAGITRLLTDDDLWHRLARAGADFVDARHGIEVVRGRFLDLVEAVMSRPSRATTNGNGAGRRFTGIDDGHRSTDEAVRRIQTLAEPGTIVLVAAGVDERLAALRSHRCLPFPQSPGRAAAPEPVDDREAVAHLESQRRGGARYFVLPKKAFTWRHRLPGLHEHLEQSYRRLHEDEHLVMYDLRERERAVAAAPSAATRVLVVGSFSAARSGPAPSLLRELRSVGALAVEQRWRSDAEPAAPPTDTDDFDYVVFVRGDAILPSGFLGDLLAAQVTLGVDRLQPTHVSGPAAGPPVTERHRGTIAREVDDVTPLPVLSVRAGAAHRGPTTLADTVTVGLRDPLEQDGGEAFSWVRRVWVADDDGRPVCHERPEPAVPPRISVLIATYNRPDLLRGCLSSFAEQSLPRSEYEVVVVDDGSEGLGLEEVAADVGDRLELFTLRIGHGGRAAAKNHAVLLARAPIVLFFDDDDRAAPDYLEQHLRTHDLRPEEGVAVLGHTDWAPELERTPVMRFITDVDRLMFAYERLADGQELDWRGFWEGRISCKRSLLVRHGLHDQRLNYSIDVEMGWRLSPRGLRIVYTAAARSVMARPISFADFCERTRAKGTAHAIVAALHPGTDIARSLKVEGAAELWERQRAAEAGLRRRVEECESRAPADEAALEELHSAYRETFRLLHARGVAEAVPPAMPPAVPEIAAAESPAAPAPPSSTVLPSAAAPPTVVPSAAERLPAVPMPAQESPVVLPPTVQPFPNTDPELDYDGQPAEAASEPVVSVTVPVWSRTPELAAMAQRTIDRIWEVARLPTEVVVVDNGSPHRARLNAKVYRYPENKGVATGWNTGIRLSTAPAIVVLNSDCMVEPGWDEALHEAATDGRRIAFPYTDHRDGAGFTIPDQAGTAGWCFMMTRAIYEEVGVFDEWFNPAFCEDTDYWHRAWRLGIELTPVPAARVVHARRTTASTDPNVDRLLQAHRYKYGWKHGVDPDRAPPYYNRQVVEYRGTVAPPA